MPRESIVARSITTFHSVPPPAPQLSVRRFSREDIDGFVTYFTCLSQDECARMGIGPARIPSPEKIRVDVEPIVASPAPTTFILSWCIEGEAIGHSSLKDIIPGESGTMHLHMWRIDLRGHGYGPRLFCLSALDFYDRFNLKRIICEPKSDNPTPNRMLQKVGFPLVLTHFAASSELTPPCEVNRYEILRNIAEQYLDNN
ncbi:MAG: GNAT family N-acetyltransferase [Chthoniobacterales bacterium]